MKLIKKIKSIIPTYQKHGLDGLVYAILKNLKLNTKFISIIEKKKFYIQKKIIKISNKTILNGIYKSTKLSCEDYWGGFDISSKLLGCYEEQVQKKILEIKKKNKIDYFVNFGAGDGYHALGLLKNNIIKYAYLFEIDNKGKNIIKNNLRINKLKERAIVFGEANFQKLSKYLDFKRLRKTLFLIDIEGDEFDILVKENLLMFKNSILIIENHDFLCKNKNKIQRFHSFMKNNFYLEVLNNGPRNPNQISEIDNLDDDEKWLIMSEGRKQTMNWLVFYPKS